MLIKQTGVCVWGGGGGGGGMPGLSGPPASSTQESLGAEEDQSAIRHGTASAFGAGSVKLSISLNLA